jgi:molybdenum cofactor cytidylyltransferase
MPPSDSSTSAVVLAAGSSSRMGAPKQLLRLDDRPLLQHVLDNVRASDVANIVLVLGASAEAIQREIDLGGVRVVVNQNYQQGMGTSLQAGISTLAPEVDSALIILADQPFVRSSTLNRLIAEHRVSKAEIVIPTYRGFRGNPVLLDRSVFPEIMKLGGDIGCRAIFGDHPQGIVKLPVDDIGILLDIDRRGDLEALRNLDDRAGREQALLERTEIKDRQVSSGTTARPELVIVGRDALAVALAKLARVLRFTVTVVDPLLEAGELPDADRVLRELDFSKLGANPDRHVVVASRGTCDEEAIEEALQSGSAYVALVANRKRGEEVLRGLQLKGIPPQKLSDVRVPAGLPIGAEQPEEIALSILAEIVSLRKKEPKGKPPA